MLELAPLTYIGIIIASLSAVWSIIGKFGDKNKKRHERFTWKDAVSLGIIGVSLLLSLVAQWRADMLSAQDRSTEELKAIAERSEQIAYRRWADEQEARRIQTVRLQENENAVRGRLLAIELENRKLSRDLALARLVTFRTNAILERSQLLAVESLRVLTRFDEIYVHIDWCVRKDNLNFAGLDLDYEKVLDNLGKHGGLSRSSYQPHRVQIKGSHPLFAALRAKNFMSVKPIVELYANGASNADSAFEGASEAEVYPEIYRNEIFFQTDQLIKRKVQIYKDWTIRSTKDLDGASIVIRNAQTWDYIDAAVADEDLDWSDKLGIRYAFIDIGGRRFKFGSDNLKIDPRNKGFIAKLSDAHSSSNTGSDYWSCIYP